MDTATGTGPEVISAAAMVRARLNARRERLQDLQGELDALPPQVEAQRAALARALADGQPERAVKEIRQKLAGLDSDRMGLEAAVQLVSAEVEALEAELQPLQVAALEAEAEHTRDAHTADLREGLALVLEFYPKLAPILERASASEHKARRARNDYLRAVGQVRDTAFSTIYRHGYARMDDVGSCDLHARLLRVARDIRTLRDTPELHDPQ